MFTGIVEGVGRIVRHEHRAEGLRLQLDAGSVDVADVRIGDSVAVDGCCLTVVAREGSLLAFDVSAETLRCTCGLDATRAVNLEKALRFGDRVGGHLVTGHVDGVGTVVSFEPAPAVAAMGAANAAASAHPAAGAGSDASWSAAGSKTLTIRVPPALARFVAAKGSVSVQGVSLTVNAVHGDVFAVNLIPHTLAVTTLGELQRDAPVNIEVDILARYVARLQDVDR